MELLNIISPPLIGGVIGYAVNYIAIKVLFQPRKPAKPGQALTAAGTFIGYNSHDIPAGAPESTIAGQLFGIGSLENIIASESFENAVADGIAAILTDPESKLSFLNEEKSGDSPALQRLKDALCVRIQAAILKSDLKKLISEQGSQIIYEKLGSSRIGKALGKNLVPAIASPIASQIEKYILENGRSFVMPLINDELNELSQEPVANIISDIFPGEDSLHSIIRDVYARFVKAHGRGLAESIDVNAIIAEKAHFTAPAGPVNSVIEIFRRKLRYIALFGGLAGVVTGAVSLLI